MAKKKNKKSNKVKKKSNNLSLKNLLFTLVGAAIVIVFLPTSALLAVGMLPTLVAYIVDRQPGKNKTFTIGVMNFSGCFPYVLQIWLNSNSLDLSFSFLMQPKTYVVMYGAAAIGYIIDWSVTHIVSAILIQRSEKRLSKIQKEKEALEIRWGTEVNGSQKLDEKGFPVEIGAVKK